MTSSPAAASVRFWIGLALFTLINLGVWVSSSLQNRPGPGVVRVVDASSADQLATTGRLHLVLDRDVFPVEHEGATLDRPPFRLDPPLAGSWKVQRTDAVVFEPRDPPPAGRVYRVTLVDAHPLFRRYAFDVDTLPTLRYRPLGLEEIRLVDVGDPDASIEGPGDRRARFLVGFNQPVLRSDLLEAMRIVVDGRPMEPTSIKDRLLDEHAFEIVVRPESFVWVEIDGALAGHDGLLGLGTDVRRSFQIAGTLRDLRAEAVDRWGHPSNRVIRIDFDRKLDPGQTVPAVSITPHPGPTTTRIQGNSLEIDGTFDWNTSYVIEVEPPLLAGDRSILDRTIRRSVLVPGPNPTLSIPVRRGQLMPDGNMTIPLRHAGYDRMRLRVDRLVDEHLPMVLSEILDSHEMPSVGERIHDESVSLSTMGKGIDESLIDLATITDRRPGMYRIGATPGERRWDYTSALVLVSDLAIDLQVGRDEIMVWTTSVSSGRPVEGAEVVAWAPNITPIRSAVSDADGIARIPLDGAACRVVTANRNGDVVFTRTRLARGIEDRRLGGAEWNRGLDLALHADRGIHRPGETIHLSGILRSDDGSTAGDTPITLELARPDGRVTITREVVTDPLQGTFSIDLTTDPLDPTGRWTVTGRLPGSASPLHRLECPVMPFLPVRLDLDSTLEVAEHDPDSDLPAWTAPLVSDVVARYLHGAPASDLQGSVVIRRRPVRYRNQRWAGFSFESPGTSTPITTELKIRTDPDGRATTTIPAPQPRGTWEIQVVSSIRELGGRSTSSTVRRVHDTAGRHLGLRLPDGRLHGADTPFTIEVLDLVEEQGRVEGAVELTIDSVQRIWTWNPEDRRGRGNWVSVESVRPVKDVSPKELDPRSSGVRRFELEGLPDGIYRITARLAAEENLAGVVHSVDLHVSRWHSEGRMALDRPDRIEIVPDRDAGVPGEEIGVLLRTPFPGTALVTVETDTFVDARVIEIDGDGARIDVRVPEEARHSCFVSATLVRPVDPERSTWNAVLARGAGRIGIDRSGHRLKPSILASDASRPGEVVPVTLSVPEAKPGALARIWAVEEGALLATDFRVPDPADHLLRERRRRVVSFSTLEDLIEDVDRPAGIDRIGGDAERSRREPIPVRIPRTRVIWNEFMPLDETGSLELDLEMPDLDGALRVMAVVVDEDRYGAVEHKIGVVPRLQIVAAFPRAMAPGDEMVVPLQIRNNLPVEQSIELELETGEGLAISEAPDHLVVGAGSVVVDRIVMTAGSPGSVPIRLVARPAHRQDPRNGDGLESPVVEGAVTSMEWTTAVRPPTASRTETHRYLVPAGSSIEIDRGHLVPMLGGRLDVTIADTPMVELRPVVDDLIDYPYGCTEQIGSRLAGLLAAIEAPSIAGGHREEAVRRLASVALSRLWMNQNTDGSLSYWSGSTSNDWLTLRTTLLVQAAEELEVPAPPGFLDGLEAACQRLSTRPKLSRPDACMAVRVLADAGRPDARLTQQLLVDVAALDLESRAHLAAALGRMGRDDECRRIIDGLTPPPPIRPSTIGRFTSDATQAAVALSVGVRYAPDAIALVPLYESIVERRANRGWRTTYESAAAVGAVVDFLRLHGGGGSAAGRVEIAGVGLNYDGEAPVHRSIATPVTSDADGDVVERIHSTGEGPLSVVITRSGHPIDDGPDEARHHGILLQRRWFDAQDRPIEIGSTVGPGELVSVEIEWSSMLGRPIPNVAIVDVLPGGMEFELPTLVTSDASGTRFDTVDHVEFRDDRILAFATADVKPRRLRYVMRSVVPGWWRIPGTRAEAMYEANVDAELPGTRMSILEP